MMKPTTRQKTRQATNKPTFVSIREQKHCPQVNKETKSISTNNSSKQMRPHPPLARQEKTTEEIKRARLPLYHPSRFR